MNLTVIIKQTVVTIMMQEHLVHVTKNAKDRAKAVAGAMHVVKHTVIS